VVGVADSVSTDYPRWQRSWTVGFIYHQPARHCSAHCHIKVDSHSRVKRL